MFVDGELVWVRPGLFLKHGPGGFGVVVETRIEEDGKSSYSVSWLVLLNGKVVEVDASHLKQLKWYNKHLCLDGSLNPEI